ncbi:MAG: hypothetical protein IJ055_09300 [Oscillospiraceae bacterium]|nr:hypothetical protein [Oscillospiraceae bacterium]
MQIEHMQAYDRFLDAIRLQLIVWRETEHRDFEEIAEKLGISARTARRRFKHPETLTLGELYAWCELYGKDAAALLAAALSGADA